jgi:membrane protease YdiL (CAAX protease family)
METTTAPAPDHTQGKLATIALLLLVPAPSIGTAASLFWWPEAPIGKTLFVAAKVWIVLLPLIWLKFIDKGKLSWSPPRQGGFVPAVVLGSLIAGFIFATYVVARKTGIIDPIQVSERAAQTGLNNLTFYLVGALYWITLNSLMEEYVWRWFVFRKFEAMVGGKMAVVASAIGFTLHHIIAMAAQFGGIATVIASFGVFVGGATWSWLYLRYRSVWPCYVSHAIVDVPIFVIGYWLIFGK